MTQPIGVEVWESLSRTKPRSDNLTARLADPSRSDRLFCAVDSAGGRHLLILIEPKDASVRDIQSRGVSAETRELGLEGQAVSRYIDLACLEPMGHAIFDALGGELADGLRENRLPTAELVTASIARWRRFWGQPPRQMLSREEQVGLFGELWFLAKWLVPKVGPSDAVRRWRGPFGARHDFEWPGQSIEVKSTTSTRGRTHRINGIEQLSPPERGVLRLFSVVLREEAGAVNSLPELITIIFTVLAEDLEATDMFERGLAQTGYTSMYLDEYSKLRLRVVEEGLFQVEGAFPRLVPESLRAGLPSGVLGVDYEIDLTGFGDLCIASRPQDLADL